MGGGPQVDKFELVCSDHMGTSCQYWSRFVQCELASRPLTDTRFEVEGDFVASAALPLRYTRAVLPAGLHDEAVDDRQLPAPQRQDVHLHRHVRDQLANCYLTSLNL